MEQPISKLRRFDREAGAGASSDGDRLATEEGRLVQEARHDRAAFAPLYRACVTPLYRYLAQQAGRPEDAEDLVAATFSKALASIDRYQEQGGFAAWLFSIARHTLRDFQRRCHPQVDVDLVAASLAAPAGLPEAQAIRAEQLGELSRLLRLLPADQQEALALRFFAGLSAAEAATVLGRSAGAVRMLVHRAVATLRKHYTQEE